MNLLKERSTSHKIVDTIIDWKCNTIIIGHNKGQKQEINMNRKNNRHFVQVPHYKFIQMITYKAQLAGITVLETEESYTSRASFLHRDFIPVYEKGKKKKVYQFSGQRVGRGLYKSDKGILNADVNGAFNIIRKLVPDEEIQGISGCSNPVSVIVK